MGCTIEEEKQMKELESAEIMIDGKKIDKIIGISAIHDPASEAPRREWPLEDRISVKKSFEAQFGEHRNTRTAAQWTKLVNVYGIRVVCKIEKMDEATVRNHMNETFSQRLKRQFKRKNHKP